MKFLNGIVIVMLHGNQTKRQNYSCSGNQRGNLTCYNSKNDYFQYYYNKMYFYCFISIKTNKTESAV